MTGHIGGSARLQDTAEGLDDTRENYTRVFLYPFSGRTDPWLRRLAVRVDDPREASAQRRSFACPKTISRSTPTSSRPWATRASTPTSLPFLLARTSSLYRSGRSRAAMPTSSSFRYLSGGSRMATLTNNTFRPGPNQPRTCERRPVCLAAMGRPSTHTELTRRNVDLGSEPGGLRRTHCVVVTPMVARVSISAPRFHPVWHPVPHWQEPLTLMARALTCGLTTSMTGRARG